MQPLFKQGDVVVRKKDHFTDNWMLRCKHRGVDYDVRLIVRRCTPYPADNTQSVVVNIWNNGDSLCSMGSWDGERFELYNPCDPHVCEQLEEEV